MGLFSFIKNAGAKLLNRKKPEAVVEDTRSPEEIKIGALRDCLLYTSPSPRDGLLSRMPSSA